MVTGNGQTLFSQFSLFSGLKDPCTVVYRIDVKFTLSLVHLPRPKSPVALF